MNCSTYRRYLNEADTAALLSQAVQQHALTCAACQMESRIHQNLLRAWEIESAPQLSAKFTQEVMAKLPALPAFKAQRNYETPLLIALILAGLAATLFVSDGLRQNLFAFGAQGFSLAALVQQVLAVTVWRWQEALLNILGEQMLQQGSQLLLISLVTAAVVKGAVMLDERLRRMLRRL